MRARWLFAAAAVLAAACSADSNQTPTGPANGPSLNLGQEPGGPNPHLFLMRGQARFLGPGGGSPDMTYHGGDIVPTSTTMAIFWGSWTSPGDKITGMDAFFTGYTGTVYNQTVTEYTGINDQVKAISQYIGHFMDASTPPRRPKTSQVLAEACKAATAGGQSPDASALYVVYSSGTRGGANYCAYHTWGSCNGTPIQAAWVFNLDGDSGCNPGTPYGSDKAGTGHSQGLAAIANVTAHELSEAITDPRGSTWYDASGAENGDKCAWTFGPSGSALLSTFGDGSTWKLQGEWSNAAYNGTYTGPSQVYANASGQKGCLAGF